MLVLTRKINESIIIGDNIEIIVVDVKHGQVKVGIKAPRSISVYRSEVYEEIQRENILAAQAKVDSVDQLQKLLKSEKEQKKSNLKRK